MPTVSALFSFADLLTWVESASGAVVHFHDLAGVTLQVPQLQLPAQFRYHHGPYCETMKREGLQPACACAKERSLQVIQRRRRPYCAACPQGIWDWIFPVEFQQEVVGVFYLGSLRKGALQPIRDRAYTGPALTPWTAERQQQLSDFGRLLTDTMRLILQQRAAGGERWSKQRPLEFYRHAAQAFIEANYHQPIRLNELAQQLKLHVNHLGRIIQQATGRSFRQLLTDYRMRKAKVLLRVGSHSVTEIAYASGFTDSNYFSTAFKRHTGQTPRQYASGGGDGGGGEVN